MVTKTQNFMIGDHVDEMNKFLVQLNNAIREYNYYE